MFSSKSGCRGLQYIQYFGKLVIEDRWLQEVVAIGGTSTVSACVYLE